MMKRYFFRLIIIGMVLVISMGMVSCKKENPIATENSQDIVPEENTSENLSAETNSPKEIVTATYALAEVKNSLKIIGRSSVIGTGISCDFTASGIEFSAYMQGAVTLGISCSNNVYFSVYVDGIPTKERVLLTPNDTVLTLANFQEGGEHTIRVLKLNEAMHSLCVLKSLRMTGYWLDVPKQAEFFVEFIGDSVTCGYGVLGDKNTQNAGSYQHADGSKTFAFLTAQALQADYSMVSCTGIGIVNGYRDFVMSDFYSQMSYWRSQTLSFVPMRTPDLVVINLGTNDQSKNVSDSDFTAKAKELIQQIRSAYGTDVPIVWCYNMMNSTKLNALQQAFSALNGEANDLYLCELPRDTAGGGGHPSAAGHLAASHTLTQYIQNKNLLK